MYLEQRLTGPVLKIARIDIVERHQWPVRHTAPDFETASHMHFLRPGESPEIPPQGKRRGNGEENQEGDVEYAGKR